MSTEEMKKSFAANFRHARGSRTQLEIAKAMGCTQSQVARWESGIGMPESTTLDRLSRVLGVDVDQLLQPVQRSFGVSLGGSDELSLRITGKHEFALTLPLRNHNQIERAVRVAKESLDRMLADSRAEVLQATDAAAVHDEGKSLSSSRLSGAVKDAADAASRVAETLREPTPQAGEPSAETPAPSPSASKQTTQRRSPAKRAPESQ